MKKLYLCLALTFAAATCGILGCARDACAADAAPAVTSPAVAPVLDAGPVTMGTVDAAVAVGTQAPSSAATPAATLPDLDRDPSGALMKLLEALRTRDWRILAAIVLVGVTWLTRRYAGKKVPWLQTDRGGVVVVLMLGVFGGVATALAARSPVTPGLLVDGIFNALMSAGIWTALRKAFPSVFGSGAKPLIAGLPDADLLNLTDEERAALPKLDPAAGMGPPYAKGVFVGPPGGIITKLK